VQPAGLFPQGHHHGRGLLFPSGVEALGDLGEGLTTEVWWTPAFPFKSTLTGQDSRQLADQWEAETNRQWTQPLGYSHAIWEVAIDALKRSGNPTDKAAIRDALKVTNMTTLAGPINFTTGPHPNVSTTPIFGGQWVKGEKWRYDLKIVDNTVNQLFAPEQKMTPLPWSL
jgi:branched-chain amino acid transport system substrate-binding protein